jgi:hypothetical protein
MNLLKGLFRKTAVLLFVLSCAIVLAQKPANNTEFNKLLDNYYEEKLLFDPITATQRGDNRYNDLLPNDIAEPYLKQQHNFFKKKKNIKSL